MPRRKRKKPQSFIPHLRHRKSRKKLGRSPSPSPSLKTPNYQSSQMKLDNLQGLSKGMKFNELFLMFFIHLIVWILISIYSYPYLLQTIDEYHESLKLKMSNEMDEQDSLNLDLLLIKYILPIIRNNCAPLICMIIPGILCVYSYTLLLTQLNYCGHDRNAYKIGKWRLNPRRVFPFMVSCLQQFELIGYAMSYYRIQSFSKKCKTGSHETDFSTIEYNDLSPKLLKQLISKANNQKLQYLKEKEAKIEKYVQETVYDVNLKNEPKSVLKLSQNNENEMICIFNVKYDSKDPYQSCDIFLPPSPALDVDYHKKNENLDKEHPATPVVIFLIGGAWSSCNTSFSASIASSFVCQNVALIYPKYRTFPNGDVVDMLSNIEAMIKWTLEYAPSLHINPNHITIIGQSSGAHLGALSIIDAIKFKSTWVSQIRLFVGLCGPYDINDHYRHESKRGVEHVSGMGRAMKGINEFGKYSPTANADAILIGMKSKWMYQSQTNLEKELKQISQKSPHFCLIHCENDYIVPITSSKKFDLSLQNLKMDSELLKYANGNHYDSVFGLCDFNNKLFSSLINDILIRIFSICNEYNELHPNNIEIIPTIERDNENNINDDDGDDGYIDADQLSNDESEQEIDEIVEEIDDDNDDDYEEVVEVVEVKKNDKLFEAKKVIIMDKIDEIDVSADDHKNNETHVQLPVLKEMEENSDESDDDDDDGDDGEIIENNNDNISINNNESCEMEIEQLSDESQINMSDVCDDDSNRKLFEYKDFSLDIDDCDETNQLLKMFVADMSKALHNIKKVNKNTKTNIDSTNTLITTQ